MRILTVFALIFLMFLSLFGGYFGFLAERNKVRKEVKQLLKAEKRKHLTTFVFSDECYTWLPKFKNGKEFCLDGKMYDVVAQKKCARNFVITAYFDHKETNLIEQFVSLFQESKEAQSSSHRYKGYITFPDFIPITFLTLLPLQATVVSIFSSTENIRSAFLPINAHPPELG